MMAHFLSINQTWRGPIRGVGSSYISAWARKWTCHGGGEIVPRPRHSRLRSFISEDVFVSTVKEIFREVVGQEENLSHGSL